MPPERAQTRAPTGTPLHGERVAAGRPQSPPGAAFSTREAQSSARGNGAKPQPGPQGQGLGTYYGICGRSPNEVSACPEKEKWHFGTPRTHENSTEPPPTEVDPQRLARIERFAAQGVAHRFLSGTLNPDGGSWRLHICLRHIAQGCGAVTVFRHLKTGRAHYGQLMRCGSGWLCTICGAQVSEFDRAEIERGMSNLTARNGRALMVTYTNGHGREHKLKWLMDKQREAQRWMASHRRFKQLSESYGRIGQVRATEITLGAANGWHPHMHDLWMLDPVRTRVGTLKQRRITARDLLRIKRVLFVLWHQACERVGLPLPSYAHGVSVEEAWSPAEYFSKFNRDTSWGSGREMTKGHIKKGRPGRYTPFDLLRGALPWHVSRDLWREYASATYYMSRVRWSKGLREALGLPKTKKDAQKVEKQQRTAERHSEAVTTVPRDDWKAILRAHARGHFLNVIEDGGKAPAAAAAGAAFIEDLKPKSDDAPKSPTVTEGWFITADGVMQQKPVRGRRAKPKVEDAVELLRIGRSASFAEPPDQRKGDGGEREHACAGEHECAERDEPFPNGRVLAKGVSESIESVECSDELLSGRSRDRDSCLHDCGSG